MDHNIFLLKLKAAGVSGIALSWFRPSLDSLWLLELGSKIQAMNIKVGF